MRSRERKSGVRIPDTAETWRGQARAAAATRAACAGAGRGGRSAGARGGRDVAKATVLRWASDALPAAPEGLRAGVRRAHGGPLADFGVGLAGAEGIGPFGP
ncbi:hypothetical protein SNE510_53590 [Streptomyces sp. NE5-10]|nr:hypothetical protein SNE510_53590 [Streptomyces sp. NE5-10]